MAVGAAVKEGVATIGSDAAVGLRFHGDAAAAGASTAGTLGR